MRPLGSRGNRPAGGLIVLHMFLIQNRFDLTLFFVAGPPWASLGIPPRAFAWAPPAPGGNIAAPPVRPGPAFPPPWDDRRLYDVGFWGGNLATPPGGNRSYHTAGPLPCRLDDHVGLGVR